MTPLPSPETIMDVVGCIYQAAYDSTLWPTVVTRLRDAFHGSKACLGHIGPNILLTDAVIAPDSDPRWTEIYVEQFADNELFHRVMAARTGTVYSDHALLGSERMRASRFWNEWMAPQDMYGGIGCKLHLSNDMFCFFDIQRGSHQSSFGTAEAQYLQQIVPHLIRAGELSRQLQATHSLAAAFSYLPFGMVVVDGAMTILSMNATAEAIVARPDGALTAKNGQLSTHAASRSKALAQAVAHVCKLTDGILPGVGSDVVVKAPEGGSDLFLSIGAFRHMPAYGLSTRPCAVIFVRDLLPTQPQSFVNHIRQMFALMPKEAAIAVAIADGLTLKSIAARENITLGTARLYLHNVFQKTGTKRQSHLVSLLKNLQPIINRD